MDLQPTPVLQWAGTTAHDVRRVRDAVGELVPASCSDDVRLLLSELATNAVLHGGGWFLVDLVRRESEVEVGVTDRSSITPVSPAPSTTRVTGRGLAIVNAVASDWGVEPLHPGKRVWFRVPVGR